MLRYLILLLAAAIVTYSNICTDDRGNWSSGIADGVTDFAYGGVPLNRNYNCFEGCLNTQTVVQNYRVKLASKNAKLVERKRDIPTLVKQYLSGQIPYDHNADFCVDATLRAAINSSLNKVPDPSCKSILNTLLLSVNRPGWCINVVKYDFGLNDVFADMNFCDYTAFMNKEIYNIRMALIDKIVRMDRRCLSLAAVLVLALGVVAQTQYGCSSIQSACLMIDNDIFICPEGMACLNNASCCKFADIINNGGGGSPTTVAPVQNCVDKINPQTGYSDCPKMASYCTNPSYLQVMKDQCPKTCGYCGGNGGTTAAPAPYCQDKINPSTGVSDCPKDAYLCTNPSYQALMRDQCPKTCGFC